MTGKPEIEIIMATYNGALFLEAQVDSLLKQTYHEWRLLVRDDSSTDNTVALLKPYRIETIAYTS
ncbi:MAG TPA: glycosyltransferase [Candidatus Binataceae bacterium]|nr:glycosyltransferase [Candidatus Binataceae bacterium]